MSFVLLFVGDLKVHFNLAYHIYIFSAVRLCYKKIIYFKLWFKLNLTHLTQIEIGLSLPNVDWSVTFSIGKIN